LWAVACRWADRPRRPWRRLHPADHQLHPRLAHRARPTPDASTDCSKNSCLDLRVTTTASRGCRCSANPKAHWRRLDLMSQDQRQGAQREPRPASEA